MNLIDLIIIYLACGAPFGVYFYLQNRVRSKSNYLWLKTTLAFVFWISFAVLIIRKSKSFKKLFIPDFNKKRLTDGWIEEKLYLIQKAIEKIIFESNLEMSLFEFRQTIERYVGLTLSLKSNNVNVTEQEKEIFRAGEIKNIEIASICLQRRNRKRLIFHQTRARQDFLQITKSLFDSISDTNKFENSVTEFVNLLSDLTAQESLEIIFSTNLQTDNLQSVKQSEKVVWKTEIPKPLLTKPISARLQIIPAITNLRRKD